MVAFPDVCGNPARKVLDSLDFLNSRRTYLTKRTSSEGARLLQEIQ